MGDERTTPTAAAAAANEGERVRDGAATCSHQDDSRKTVSVTAHGVAYLRGLEAALHPHDALYCDPYALALGGNIGKSWSEGACQNLGAVGKEAFAISIAVRTKKIDQTLDSIVRAHPTIRQICTLGAGLDTRPWRLELPSVPVDERKQMSIFELDFDELFQFKLPLLEKAGARCMFNYRTVSADLTTPTWAVKLQAAGFNPAVPTVWLLEGLTGYLTKEENEAMFLRIREHSAPGSHIVATFVTPAPGKVLGISLHRFHAQNPLAFVRSCGGWEGQALDLADAADEFRRRPSDNSPMMRGYFLVVAHV